MHDPAAGIKGAAPLVSKSSPTSTAWPSSNLTCQRGGGQHSLVDSARCQGQRCPGGQALRHPVRESKVAWAACACRRADSTGVHHHLRTTALLRSALKHAPCSLPAIRCSAPHLAALAEYGYWCHQHAAKNTAKLEAFLHRVGKGCQGRGVKSSQQECHARSVPEVYAFPVQLGVQATALLCCTWPALHRCALLAAITSKTWPITRAVLSSTLSKVGSKSFSSEAAMVCGPPVVR